MLLDEIQNLLQTHFELVDLPAIERSDVKFGIVSRRVFLRSVDLNWDFFLVCLFIN